MLNLYRAKLRKLTHRFGLSPLMLRARHRARTQNAWLRFGHDAIRWERDQWVLLFPPDPYRILPNLTYAEEIVRTAIPEKRGGKLWIDARRETRYTHPSGGAYWSLIPPEKINTLRGYLARGAPGAGDVVLDVGAYVGETAIAMAGLVGPTGHVHALEPDAMNLRLLRRNLAEHAVTNVTAHPRGLWHSTGTARFVEGRNCASMLQAAVSTGIGVSRSIEIQTVSPEDLIKEIGAVPTFIKMDVEGVEAEIMPDLAAYYAARSLPVRLAIASYHVRGGLMTSEIITPVLQAAGFTVETGYSEHQTTWAWRD